MANALGTLAGTLILQRALAMVFNKRPLLKNITLNLRDLDTGSSEAKFNQVISTRVKGVPTVNNFGTGAVDTADVDVNVTLDQFKEVQYDFTVQQYSATSRDLIDEHAEPMAIAIANHLVDAVATLWTAANFTTNTVKAAGWDYNHLNSVRKVFSQRGVPENQRRFYAASADVYESMLNDTLIVAGLNNPNNADAIRDGFLPQVSGFGVSEYPDLPTTNNMVGFAGTPDSSVLVVRVPKNPNELMPGVNFPGNIGIVTEPTTGLSVMVTQYITPSTLTATNRMIFMYGKAVGRANNGQRITSV